jgi:hypothetical protein
MGMLTNVARHSTQQNQLPIICIEVKPSKSRLIKVQIEEFGSGFDLREAIVLSDNDKDSTHRHGLWRVKQLAADMEARKLVNGFLVTCYFYDIPRPVSVFDGLPSTVRIRFVWEYPREFWIRNSMYDNGNIIYDLDVALNNPYMRPLFELYFGRMPHDSEYLGIESFGDVVLSEAPPYAGPTLARAIEHWFRPYFLAGHVFLINESSSYLRSDFQLWKDRYAIPLFSSAEACAAHLKTITRG